MKEIVEEVAASRDDVTILSHNSKTGRQQILSALSNLVNLIEVDSLDKSPNKSTLSLASTCKASLPLNTSILA